LRHLSLLIRLNKEGGFPGVQKVLGFGWRSNDSLNFDVASEREEVNLYDVCVEKRYPPLVLGAKQLLLSRCFSTVLETAENLYQRHRQVITRVDLVNFCIREGWKEGYIFNISCGAAASTYYLPTSGRPHYATNFPTLGDTFVALLLCLCGLYDHSKYSDLLLKEEALSESEKM
jgi:hypothetical protein